MRGQVLGETPEVAVRIGHATTRSWQGRFQGEVDVPTDAPVEVKLVHHLADRSAVTPCSDPITLVLDEADVYTVTLSPSAPGACGSPQN